MVIPEEHSINNSDHGLCHNLGQAKDEWPSLRGNLNTTSLPYDVFVTQTCPLVLAPGVNLMVALYIALEKMK